MELYRKTYAEINLTNIKENVEKIIKKYNNYQYYFGIVKADCYGHGIKAVQKVIEGGANYLATATLEEALSIRKNLKDIPILCLGIIPLEYIPLCEENNITVTISSVLYAEKLSQVYKNSNLKVHIKINSGMNRLGITTKESLNKIANLLKETNIFIEGIYTHIFHAQNKEDTLKQFDKYQNIISDIDKTKIPIFHLAASETITLYPKFDFINGCRLGIIMYGFTLDESLNLQSTFKLSSRVIQINNLKKGDKVGYNGIYIASEDEKIAVVPIGYADGIIRKNTGREVYINGKKYPIVGNICMDMLFVKIDDNVKLEDEVLILKDINHIKETAKYLETIPYEVLCLTGKRVPRLYIK